METNASTITPAAASQLVHRRDSHASGMTPIANHTGGGVLDAEAIVIAMTPANEPARSTPYASSASAPANSSPTFVAASRKTRTTQANSATTIAMLPAKFFAPSA